MFTSSFLRYNLCNWRLPLVRSLTNAASAPKPFTSIPGPKPAPIIGNLKDLKEIMKGNAGEDSHFHKLAKQYGDLYLLKSFSSLVVLSNPELIAAAFKNEGKCPIRSSFLELNLKWVHDRNNMPVGLFTAYMNEWKSLRMIMTKHVNPRRLEHFGPVLSTVADDLCNHIDDQRDDNGWMIDIWHPLKMWAMKGVTKIVFNEDVDTFSKGNAQVDSFVEAVHSFMTSLGEMSMVPPLYKLYPTKPYKRYVSSFNQIRKIGKELLNNHYERLRADIEAGVVDEDTAVGILDQWLIEGKLTEDEALVQACDMLFAGVDTTSSAATYMLYELAKNPEVQNAVHKQIMEVIGPHDSPSIEQLQKLSLVRKCVKETLRMYPLPAYPREVQRDCVLMGYHIPAGTTCMFNFYSISKDSRYFKDPLQFDPDRWSRDTIHPYASLPFGFGPRSCYGRRIAELELHLLLTRILQRFQLSTDQNTLKLIIKTILKPNESVRVKFTHR